MEYLKQFARLILSQSCCDFIVVAHMEPGHRVKHASHICSTHTMSVYKTSGFLVCTECSELGQLLDLVKTCPGQLYHSHRIDPPRSKKHTFTLFDEHCLVLAMAKPSVRPSVRPSTTNMRWWRCAKTVIARNTKLSRTLPICRYVVCNI